MLIIYTFSNLKKLSINDCNIGDKVNVKITSLNNLTVLKVTKSFLSSGIEIKTYQNLLIY